MSGFEKKVSLTGDRGFESFSLQRGVGCELDFLNHGRRRPFVCHDMAFGIWVDLSPERDPLPRVGLRVRIRLPPAASQVRTRVGVQALILILDNHEFFRQVGVALTTV